MIKSVEIAPRVFMPMIGVGTWEMRDKNVLHNVLDAALGAGYRFIDTAHGYQNETFIGQSLQTLLPKYNLSRQDIFITSKLPPSHQGTTLARKAVEESLANLQTDYIDLYLIHYPGASKVDPSDLQTLKKLRSESWKVLENFLDKGQLRSIGVSNYLVRHLEEMKTYCKVLPAVNQCEFHPYNIYADLVSFCQTNKVHFQAYSSLGTAHSEKALLKDALVLQISQKYSCEPTQLLLAWAMNQGVSVLPKTTKPEHVVSNFAAKDITLDDEDVKSLAALNRDHHFSWSSDKVA